MVPTFLVVVTLSFFLMRLAPGGPFDLERPLDPRIIENLKRAYGLDRPLLEQYLAFIQALAHGDLGPSMTLRDFSVAELLFRGLPISALIGTLSLLLALSLGIWLGALAAERPGSGTDRTVDGLTTLAVIVPTFVTAPLLQMALALMLRLLPVAGYQAGNPAYLVMPVLALALPQAAIIARLMRSAMLESLAAPYMRTLRSLGLSAAQIRWHAIRASLLPIVSYLGPAAAGLLTGSVVIETIFAIPGIGRYFVDGALNRDYPLVMGTVILVAALILLFNLLADLLYLVLDPRIEAGG